MVPGASFTAASALATHDHAEKGHVHLAGTRARLLHGTVAGYPLQATDALSCTGMSAKVTAG